MRQLVGLACRLCNNRIGSVLDARFCGTCHNPIHNACAASRPASVEGRCLTCGVDLAAATEADRIDEQKRRPPAPPPPPPVSRVCPRCGGVSFRSVRPKGMIAFGWDRVCKGCGTQYTPPTPRWAGIAFVILGLPLTAFGGVSIALRVGSGNVLGIPAMACEGFVAVLGVLAVVRGIRSFISPGKV
jgi:hypothetical protein